MDTCIATGRSLQLSHSLPTTSVFDNVGPSDLARYSLSLQWTIYADRILYGHKGSLALAKDAAAMADLAPASSLWPHAFTALVHLRSGKAALAAPELAKEYTAVKGKPADDGGSTWGLQDAVYLAREHVRLACRHRLMGLTEVPVSIQAECEVHEKDLIPDPELVAKAAEEEAERLKRANSVVPGAGATRRPKKHRVQYKEDSSSDSDEGDEGHPDSETDGGHPDSESDEGHPDSESDVDKENRGSDRNRSDGESTDEDDNDEPAAGGVGEGQANQVSPRLGRAVPTGEAAALPVGSQRTMDFTPGGLPVLIVCAHYMLTTRLHQRCTV